MNTSRYAESYRIQTYAEYMRARRPVKDVPSQPAPSWGEEGWVKSQYTTTAGYRRTAGKRSISPSQADQDLDSQTYAGVVGSRTSEGWLKTPCTSESSGLSPIHEEQSAEGPVVANEAEAENTWQNPTTNRGKKARKNDKKRKNEGSESAASLFDVPVVW
ncbi:hypothetical protein CRUP_016095 [Coryphaenoides rupestris]|nr:hypothetical protein CRUP_016095 [Coryphaenoides rupestris]